MDEYETRTGSDTEFNLAKHEYSPPRQREEFSPPPPESEFSEIRAETVELRTRGKGSEAVKRIIRYSVTAAVSLGLLVEAPPPPPEATEVPSAYGIATAAVLPEEPDVIYLKDFMRSPHIYAKTLGEGDEPAVREWGDMFQWQNIRIEWYLVEPDGGEISLEGNEVESRYVRSELSNMSEYSEFDEDRISEYRVYDTAWPYDEPLFEDPEWSLYGNLGYWNTAYRIPGGYREGLEAKLVIRFDYGGGHWKMVTQRPVDLMPPDADIPIRLEAEPLGNGYDQVFFQAVFRPQEGDDHDYVFRHRAITEEDEAYLDEHETSFFISDDYFLTIASFATRWYDADHRFLGGGWENVAPRSMTWPFPEVDQQGRDYVFTYDGPVCSESTLPEAAYYSLELHVIDASTGWHYLIESEQLPISR
ncbi:MAG: hypothetical protein J5967_02000 [Oscillospiraceae bacterium]|nr:hypothetical protein [Oscillospiraceae bacterium]